jgi:large subunit ribosomal protein L22
MEVSATHRYAGVSPRKVRLVLENLPGRPIEEALNLLKFLPTPHARIVAKIVKSAASNAENNYAMDPGSLYIKRAVANDSRRLKRYRPQSRGRYNPYMKRTAHITIVVDEREE